MAIAKSDAGLTTREISEQVGIGRQATYHLLHTLTATGMVTRAGGGSRYVLGLRVGTLAEAFSRQLAPSEHLAPLVRALARETGETSYASGWWSGEVMMLSIARGSNPVQAAEVSQGHAGDAHARASGKLLLATATPAVRDAYLDTHKLNRLTPSTITTRRALERELETIRRQGYAIDDEEFAPGLSCIAMAMDEGYSPFVLVVTAPRERFLAKREEYLAILRRVVATGAPVRDGE